jgi:hypothetical protein
METPDATTVVDEAPDVVVEVGAGASVAGVVDVTAEGVVA